MKIFYYAILAAMLCCYRAAAQTDSQTVGKNMEQTSSGLDRFSRKCDRRTLKAQRRMDRYEKKLAAKSGDTGSISVDADRSNDPVRSGNTVRSAGAEKGLGKEPMLDSLRTAYGFAGQAGIVPDGKAAGATQSISRAQHQLNATQEVKTQLQQRKDKWKAQVKDHPEYARTVGKMEKESYYYTAQVNEYRKALRDPSVLDDKVMSALRKDPRWNEYLAALPSPQQDPAKMQPKELVKQMMQSQAGSIDPDALALIKDAQKKGSDVLGAMSGGEVGNIDNASQIPSFTPNPYKTKSFWDRIDVGFDLEFDNKTYFLPSCGVAGVQAAFNFSQRFSTGILGNYRFGMGEIKHIRFSHIGYGYGAFANYRIWKGLGAQAGFERNYRVAIDTAEGQQFDSGWTSSLLAGLTWEYGIGKKAKGTVGVFYDILHNRHTPQTNALVWRMGWKL